MADIIPCVIKRVPKKLQMEAAQKAVEENPNNHPASHRMAAMFSKPTPMKLALMVGRRWPSTGVRLTVGFMDSPPSDLQNRILQHLNAWSSKANVQFVQTDTDPQVRITRRDDAYWGGYWSYLGTDVLLIPPDEPTMNLEGFTMNTDDSEFYRVVRHEAGHTLGFPHEHMRRTLVSRLDKKKVIAYFMATQGWSEEEVKQQVLTPLEAVTIKGSYRVDDKSIMCYRIQGALTKSGRPIPGGSDITEADHRFAAAVYPRQRTN